MDCIKLYLHPPLHSIVLAYAWDTHITKEAKRHLDTVHYELTQACKILSTQNYDRGFESAYDVWFDIVTFRFAGSKRRNLWIHTPIMFSSGFDNFLGRGNKEVAVCDMSFYTYDINEGLKDVQRALCKGKHCIVFAQFLPNDARISKRYKFDGLFRIMEWPAKYY